jgi:hypothetical protein
MVVAADGGDHQDRERSRRFGASDFSSSAADAPQAVRRSSRRAIMDIEYVQSQYTTAMKR